MKLEFYGQFLKKFSNKKFHENLSIGRRVSPCGQTDGWTDMTKLIVTFFNFVKAPKKVPGTFGTCFSVQGLMLL